MKNIIKLIPIILLTFIINLGVIAQQLQKETIVSSEIIVEGSVYKKEYRYSKSTSNYIETLNYINVSKILKGNSKEKTLLIITKGGIMDDHIERYSHGISFVENQKGIFFLDKINENQNEIYTKLSDNKNPFIQYVNNKSFEAISYNKKVKYKNRSKLLTQISPDLQNDIKQIMVGSELCLSIDNIQPDITNKKIRFIVKIKADISGYKFSEMQLIFSYPVRNFGPNIEENQNISLDREVVIDNDIYYLSTHDVDTNSISINITSDCFKPDPSVLYELSNSYEKLLSIEMNVENWGNYGDLKLSDFEIKGIAKYYILDRGCVSFDELCVEGRDFPISSCSITKVETSPFGAGINQILHIQGNGFNNGGVINIPNADDGGTTNFSLNETQSRWIKEWSDTDIKVLISSLAPGDSPMGSGKWEILPDLNLKCSEDIEIEYSISNSTQDCPFCIEGMNSIATNPYAGNNSFKWYLDKNGISTNAKLIAQGITFNMVKDVCEAAFCDWEIATDLEFEYAGDNPNGEDETDEKYTITFNSTPPSINPGLTHLDIILLCDASMDPFIRGRIKDADILLNEDNKWFVSTSPSGITNNQFDFYSVLLHEIGHMISLEHAMDLDSGNGTSDDRIMYWSINPKQIKRHIDSKSKNGIKKQKERTKKALEDCLAGYKLNTSSTGCSSSTFDIRNVKIYLKNPISAGNYVTIQSDKEISEFRLLSIQGNVLSKINNIDNSTFTYKGIAERGVYFVQVKVQKHWITKKLIVL